MALSEMKPSHLATSAQPLADSPMPRSEADCTYLFYCHESGNNESISRAESQPESVRLSDSYRLVIWRPGVLPMLPRSLPGMVLKARFLFRWALHRTHLFAGRESGALLIYDRERLVHYSGFTPRYWRFPFIADGDFQIGDTWTDPQYRGKGIALFAVREIVRMLAKRGRRIWYVVESQNQPSIRVVEKGGFDLVAEGVHLLPFGLTLAGSYVPRTPVGSPASR
jgi:RimJ/RimL family protein N-acetyltransferase